MTMEASCKCVDNVRLDSFEKVPFRICLNCQFLEWDTAGGLSFIRPRYTFQLTISRAVSVEIPILEFLRRLEGQLDEKEIYPKNKFLVDYEYLDFYKMDEELSWEDMLTDDTENPMLSVRLSQEFGWWRLMVQPQLEEGDDLDTLTSMGFFVEPHLADYSTDELLHGTLFDMRDSYGEYLLKDTGNRVADTISTLKFGSQSISAILKEYEFV